MGKKKRTERIIVNEKWCKGCEICIAFCPKKVYDKNKKGQPIVSRIDDCIYCRLCELRCPDFAITLVRSEENDGKE